MQPPRPRAPIVRTRRALAVIDPELVETRRRELPSFEEVETEDPGLTLERRLADGSTLRLHLVSAPPVAVELARRLRFDVAVIDNRQLTAPERGFAETLAGRLLPELMAVAGPARVQPRRTIFVVLPDAPFSAHHAFAVGSLQLGGVIVNPQTLDSLIELVAVGETAAGPVKGALCLAGGGLQGLFWELGVLRALDEVLVGGRIVDFDIFSGISAGAVLCAFLANGVAPREIADALHERPSRIAPITRGVLFDPNLGEVARRALGLTGDLVRGRWLSQPVDSAMKLTPTALFSGDKMREYLERELAKPGLTDSFTRLDRELFIGVTDQDTGEHVIFGEAEHRDVPISRAVRASTAMTPYYAPEPINGRWYVDGIFTRTIDLDVAVAHGARLVVCVDPMTPVQADEPGFVASRGGVFNTVQSIKAMVRTRFSEVIDRAEEAYPDLGVFVFSPVARDMEQMSGTMMRFINRTETEAKGYESAMLRILQDFDWLAADLERVGFGLDRARAEQAVRGRAG